MVVNRNPVSAALSMIICFLGVAALFVGLNAYFIATIQILVYAGAIMVLFVFIIMLLDLRSEGRRKMRVMAVATGLATAAVFLVCLLTVLDRVGAKGKLQPELSAGPLGDVQAIGQVIYTDYAFALQIIGVLLLVATVGTVVLSKRNLN